MIKRWQMNRVGILNFWYYDEQEFHVQNGRLLFRGANGAGKSVTMQSFLPLVLDGDTRPVRLDPFGSRDRKIDFYLLGEDGEHTDRTGYLWMEFYHPEQDRYLTIGIGLRARRSRSHLDFWGFAITDNRRIGHDLELYQRDFSQGEEERIPLDWKALRQLIGNGGEVEQERKEYRKLVNKLLFKYEDVKHFQEMLDVMIQLRSPKLSKDFKPTTIYEILNDGLPPLQEDELRPLAEVLESIDQIGERKKELERHVESVERLSSAYEKYNQYQLYKSSDQVVRVDDQRLDMEQVICEKEAESAQMKAETAHVQEQLENARQEERTAQAEIGILEQDEAFEKERELKNKQEQRKALLEEIRKTNVRLKNWQERHRVTSERLKDNVEKREENEIKQQDTLSELEALAADVELRYHNVFHGRFSREIPDDELMFDSWKKGIDEHERSLKTAFECAQEHKQAKKRVQEKEAELGIATQRRDQAEADMQQSELLLETKKEEQQTKIFEWRKGAQILKLEDAELAPVLQLLTVFPEIAYEQIKDAATERSRFLFESIYEERAGAEAEKKRLVMVEQAKMAELQTWKNQREPEPPRSLHREQTRATYVERNMTGVPLYAACEFGADVSEEKRAVLETVLQETGLLDAWICVDGLQWTREDEEFWVQPTPLDFGYTLADYLRPTPPEDGTVTAAQIHSILRSIEVGDTLTASERVVISEDGKFRMGSLVGQVRSKSRAEYIGKESRKQTRIRMILQLEAEITEIRTQIGEQDQLLRRMHEQETTLKSDVAAFPSGTELIEAYQQVQTAKGKWNLAIEELERKNEGYKKAILAEQEVSRRLHEVTRDFFSLKDEIRLMAAMEQMRAYREGFYELRSQWNQYVQLQKAIVADQQELEQATEHVEIETEYFDEYHEQLHEVEAVIQAYENALREMGVEEMYAKLKHLRERVEELAKHIKSLLKQDEDLKITRGILEGELTTHREALRETVSNLKIHLLEWRQEWNLKLIEKWREKYLAEERDALLLMCRQIGQAYRSSFETRKNDSTLNSLYAVFNEVRTDLHEYVLEMIADDSGRQLVQFNYDRKNPVTPAFLLKELQGKLDEQNALLTEREKELLEKVLIQSVGVAIREKIQRADEWVKQMNILMGQRQTSSGLQLRLKWEPKPKQSETEMDTSELVELLRIDYEHLTDEKRERIHVHFQEQINRAKQEAEGQHSLKQLIQEFLDYRDWYRFKLNYKKGGRPDYRELTDSSFNVMSGGEKAMTMYIPLFAAVSSRYKGSSPESPKLVSLDEAFAGVDEENVRDMFELLTQMEFDYMMTSQALWGCYDTVPGLSIYEIVRPKDADEVVVISYIWNGKERIANFQALENNFAV